MTDVADLLNPIRERADKATEGPWESEPTRPGEYMPYYGVKSAALGWNVVHAQVDWEGFGHGSNQKDAEFISAARTDIPRLLAALDGVLALHYEDLFRGHLSNGCKTCGHDWPCPTVAAVVAALQEGDK